jgi:hypothetical protein
MEAIMGKTVMGAVMSLDGYMADDNDGVGPLFDWLENGEVAWAFEGAPGESHTTQASTGSSTWPPVKSGARPSSSA